MVMHRDEAGVMKGNPLNHQPQKSVSACNYALLLQRSVCIKAKVHMRYQLISVAELTVFEASCAQLQAPRCAPNCCAEA
jgi:hypothetical protein